MLAGLGGDAAFDGARAGRVRRCFRDPAAITASCEDYRAAAMIDLEHDAEDRDARVRCPLLVLWGADSKLAEMFDPLEVWRRYALDVSGTALPCGHFLPEEAPAETVTALLSFPSNPCLTSRWQVRAGRNVCKPSGVASNCSVTAAEAH